MTRGLTGSIERSWSGAPGTVPWTLALYPLAILYAGGSAFARARAERARRGIPGLRVVAIGGLTAGGSGKSSLAAWLASELRARGGSPAILLRGHRARRPADAPYVVPDFERYPALEASARGGDEAAAHRGALPVGIPVAAHRDRYASAKLVQAGYGARVAILDDGWEQSTLRWDELWAVLDPDLPVGNGAPIPAGPLRRPLSSIRDASVIALIEDDGGDPRAGDRLEWIRARAGAAQVVRFRRLLATVSPLGARRGRAPDEGARPGNEVAPLPPAGLVSGIGAPERLERFARGAGIDVVSHAAFPDHASWTAGPVEAAMDAAARRGARVVLTTEKDEARWPRSARAAVPVLVLRTTLEPLDPVESILARLCGPGAVPADRVASTAP
ncbi:MAG TPA: tetraacyldisaccharide 4'-kinase [Candidatus Eisenbacteria bacterium]|nr:tetraacyldisaccharide 4'-kinase [Candidatus Eisenbacteria bacterium]